MQIERTDLYSPMSRVENQSVPTAPKSEPSALQTLAQDSCEVGSSARAGYKTVTFEFDGRQFPEVKNVGLKGSFNPESGLHDASWNQGQSIAMRDDGKGGDKVAGDGVYTATVELKEGQQQQFQWGVVGDVVGNKGDVKTSQWLVMSDVNPTFKLSDSATQTYAPVSTHLFGVHKSGADGISFQTWSPAIGQGQYADYKMCVDITDPATGKVIDSLPMEKDAQHGTWSLTKESGWKELKGKTYRYAARNEQGEILRKKDGTPVTYGDPHARYLQGGQRGLERIFVDPVLGFETGWYDDSGKGGPNYADNPQWGRFTVDSHPNADSVKLVLRDSDGHQLTKAELLDRLGEPKKISYDEASEKDKHDVDVLKSWKLDKTEPIDKYSWMNGVQDDGSIDMKRIDSPGAGTAWVTAVNNFPQLIGLSYEFQVVEDGQLLGDINGDGSLSGSELKTTPFNDPYSNVITAKPGSARQSLIRESSYEFRFDEAPRKQTDPSKFVIYEAHVGSFMSSKDNLVPATFEDMINNLNYLESLGVDTIETLPIQEFGAKRDWGYTPDYYYAGSEAYGFEMDRQQALDLKLIEPDDQPGSSSVWIAGTDALKLFVDEAHKRGFNVLADVVYNHTSGKPDADDPVGQIGGDDRSFFNWYGKGESFTPWGAKPNYADQNVKDFYSDNAAQQVTEFGFDGIRFDFTQVLHATGSQEEQLEGMKTLRQINRTVQFVHPGAYTVAEDFTGNWLVSADLDQSEYQDGVEKKGMGFGGVWSDRFHDDLLEMAQGIGSADRLMDSLLHHHGTVGWDHSVTYSVSHDEVGNTGNWIHRGAAGSKEDEDVKQSFPRAISRTASSITLLGPGVPMLFQGEEFLANNDFKHGLTSTWGADMDWLSWPATPDKLAHYEAMSQMERFQCETERSMLSPEEQKLFDTYMAMSPEQKSKAADMANQAGQFVMDRDLISLRNSSPAFSAKGNVSRIQTHNDDKIVAFKRDGGGSNDEFIVISNFANMDRAGYPIDLPAGQWKEIFNTNGQCYGGAGTGNGGCTFNGGSKTGVYLPSGSTIVLKKV